MAALGYERGKAKERQNLGEKIPEGGGRATQKLATKFKTNRKYIESLEKLSKEAPEKFEAVLSGEVRLQEIKREQRHAERIENLKEIFKANPEMNISQRYPVIYPLKSRRSCKVEF